jgi:hypothetical protein
MIEIIEFVKANWVLLYLLAGLITLMFMLSHGFKDPDDALAIRDGLGDILLWGLIGWPYVLWTYVFSFEFWLKPVKR